MATSVSYRVIAPFGLMANPHSTAHAKGGFQAYLVSCVAGSSNSSSGMTLNLSADIKGLIYYVGGNFITSKSAAKVRNFTYSSASGSASTGVVLAYSTAVSSVLAKKGQDLSSDKWRWLVIARDVG